MNIGTVDFIKRSSKISKPKFPAQLSAMKDKLPFKIKFLMSVVRVRN